jgi:peptide/nickel transport system substrate-binding protein
VIRRASLAALLVATIATGVGGSATNSLTLRIVSAEDVDSLDPALALSDVSLPILAATCSKLFEFGPRAAAPRAEVAAGWPYVSPDRRTYAFTVRQGFRFSDGSQVTAANFAAAIERIRNPDMRSPWASFTSDIRRVTAHGPRTLVVTLQRPAGDLVARLASHWACPIPVRLPPDPLGIDEIPGSGPYVVSSRTPGREIVLRRNSFYRGTRLRRPDEVIVTIGGTAAANAEAVEAGRFDYVHYFWLLPPPPGTLIEEISARHGVNRTRFFARPSLGTVYLALNTERPLFRNNRRLRRAVNLALDRAEILRQGGVLRGERTDQLLPPKMPGFVPRYIYPLGTPALASARRLAAGNLRGARAVLYVGDEPTALRRAEVIRANLARIGLVVDIRSFPRPVLAARAAQRGEPFDLVLTGWHAHYGDPAEFLVSLLGGTIKRRDNMNLSYFQGRSGEIQAAHRLHGPKRYRALGALEVDIMRRDAPVAPLFHPYSYWLVSERVHCFAERQLGVDYGSVCLR